MNIIDKRGTIPEIEIVPEIGDVFTWNDTDNSDNSDKSDNSDNSDNIYIRVNHNDHMIIKTKNYYPKEDYILVFNITSNYIGYVTLEELTGVRLLNHELVIKEIV